MKNYLENIDRDALRARAEQMLRYADDARTQAGRWTDFAITKAHSFSVLDYAVFKVCLLSLGLWLGSCFSRFFKKFRVALFVAFTASWLYMLWRVFFDCDED